MKVLELKHLKRHLYMNYGVDLDYYSMKHLIFYAEEVHEMRRLSIINSITQKNDMKMKQVIMDFLKEWACEMKNAHKAMISEDPKPSIDHLVISFKKWDHIVNQRDNFARRL